MLVRLCSAWARAGYGETTGEDVLSEVFQEYLHSIGKQSRDVKADDMTVTAFLDFLEQQQQQQQEPAPGTALLQLRGLLAAGVLTAAAQACQRPASVLWGPAGSTLGSQSV